MNESFKPQTCQSDLSYCKFGSETLLKLLAVFEDQIDGVIKNDDIEYVHKTRVTSRRLRATMPLFRDCFCKKEFKEWLFEIKKVTRLLGNARDLDVQIVFVEKYIEKLESADEKAYLEILAKSHKERRKSVQPLVDCGLEELRSTYVLDGLRRFCEQTVKEQTTGTFASQEVLEKARWHISFRLDDFLAMENYVHLENDILKHHQMRICAKKLRYAMESFAPLYQNKLAKETETIKTFQEVLGEMHDCDVWTEYIPKFMQDTTAEMKLKREKTTETTKPEKALLNFLNFVKEKRREHYVEFARFWDENKEKDFFVHLMKTINAKDKEK
jgi:CHAD domain-containing protein